MSQRMGTIYPGAPGATGRQARARSLAEHATSNTTEEANDRCRTPDDSTAEDEHSDHNRTTPATRQAPTWAPFTFQGLSRGISHATHGRFVEARPARPTSTRLRSRRPRQPQSGGSIVAKTKTHTGLRRRIARKDWRNHGTHGRMRRARGQKHRFRRRDGARRLFRKQFLLFPLDGPRRLGRAVQHHAVDFGNLVGNQVRNPRHQVPIQTRPVRGHRVF